MTDRLIRITTALAVVAVAGVAAIISYQHAYELVTSHGETAELCSLERLVPDVEPSHLLCPSDPGGLGRPGRHFGSQGRLYCRPRRIGGEVAVDGSAQLSGVLINIFG